mmetsp:Transcript_9456/g.18210  ORF Transcript_9456/g.18210 Transcript_9456/m.18210 type:complete len:383 (+) Transcript_9456:601-1749(+)
MKVLMVEILTQSIPTDMPLVRGFDRVLFTLSENTVVDRYLGRICKSFNDFLESSDGLCVIKTRSELERGVIAARVAERFDLTVHSTRSDIYTELLPCSVYKDKPKLLQDKGQLDKLCNIYKNSILTSQRVRAPSVEGARAQILEVLDRFNAAVIDDPYSVAQEVFNVMLKEGYYSVAGSMMIYNNEMCRHNPARKSQKRLEKSRPKLELDQSDKLLISCCNDYLNSYLASEKSRQEYVSQVKRAIVRIAKGKQASVGDQERLKKKIFDWFMEMGYYKVKEGRVQYNLDKCKSGSVRTGSEQSLDGSEVSSEDQEDPHVRGILAIVNGKTIRNGTELVLAVQQSLLEYERQTGYVFSASEVNDLVPRCMELAEYIYNILKPAS